MATHRWLALPLLLASCGDASPCYYQPTAMGCPGHGYPDFSPPPDLAGLDLATDDAPTGDDLTVVTDDMPLQEQDLTVPMDDMTMQAKPDQTVQPMPDLSQPPDLQTSD